MPPFLRLFNNNRIAGMASALQKRNKWEKYEKPLNQQTTKKERKKYQFRKISIFIDQYNNHKFDDFDK